MAKPAGATADTEGVDATTQQAQAMGLTPWYRDFPLPVPLSPRQPGQWYGRSSRQALVQLVANLQGNCTQAAWQHARMFFDHAPPGAADLLMTAADEHYLDQGLAAYLENLADAMGRVGDPALVPVLLRLADHPKEAVGMRAIGALMTCGTPEGLRAAEPKLDRLSLRATCDWLRAVARRAPQDVVEVFVRYLKAPRLPVAVVETILDEATKLPVEQGVAIASLLTDPRSTTPELALEAAGILHRGGDRRGTARLREFMRGDNPKLKALAVTAAAEKDLDLVLDDVLQLSLYEDAEVRLAVARAIADQPGDNVDEALTSLGADVVSDVRRVALRALAARGKRYHLDLLVERVRSGSGSNLSTALQDISASGDPKALAAVFERLKATPIEEQRAYMQALSYSRSPAAFDFLAEVFLGEERVLTSSGQTTVSNAALLLSNITGALPRIVELWHRLPRADYRRRAHLIQAMANIAGFSDDAAVRAQACDAFASVWPERDEIPQLRLLALHHHRRYLTLDDVAKLKASLEKETEPMQRTLNDFLLEFF
ncbi:MAG: hypothetical protein R3F56_16475 [Planctomycetota bacterium]